MIDQKWIMQFHKQQSFFETSEMNLST